MAFYQEPPELKNQFEDDRVLRNYLSRTIPPDTYREMETTLHHMGELAAGPLWQLTQESRLEEPRLIPYDPWGRRIDRIEVPPAWKTYARVATTEGLVATAYERRHQQYSRIHQFSLVYLFDRSSSVYTCPLAMTDGAARTLLLHGNDALQKRILPRLLSREPEQAWTSGQWMTERSGGSDVSGTGTIARPSQQGWRLYGTKWFTSATTSEVALTLARPENAGPGSSELALFLVERTLSDGSTNNIKILRLKNKLGTRMLPTAELELDGALASPLGQLNAGVRKISPMLNITRCWNAICSVASLRRSIALCRDYAWKRRAFGSTLARKPLHLETLADLQTTFESAFHLAFRIAELLGQEEADSLPEERAMLLRLLTPIAKLTTARQAVAGASECLEAFGGAGYVEDTGLPAQLRDAQVLTIWEGTTNVLALDALRVMQKDQMLTIFLNEVRHLVGQARHPSLANASWTAQNACKRIEEWLPAAQRLGTSALESGARRLAMTLGRVMQLALLIRQAQWDIEHHRDGRAAAAAKRTVNLGIDSLLPPATGLDDAAALAVDEPIHPH